jgi:hypothetical protein
MPDDADVRGFVAQLTDSIASAKVLNKPASDQMFFEGKET